MKRQRVRQLALAAVIAGPLLTYWIIRKAIRTFDAVRSEPSADEAPKRIPIVLVEPAAGLREDERQLADAVPDGPDEPSHSTVWDCPVVPPEAKYLASRDRDRFHRIECRWAKQIAPENRLCIAEREVALNQGYTPCGSCKP